MTKNAGVAAHCNKSRDPIDLLEKLPIVSSAQRYSTWQHNSMDFPKEFDDKTGSLGSWPC